MFKRLSLARSALPVAVALLLVLSLTVPKVTHAAAPTGASATVTNSTATTVDVVLTGTGFSAFAGSSTTAANAADLVKITYRGVSSTAATINNTTTITATFPISIGTDKSGSFVIATSTVQDSSDANNDAIIIVNGSITDTASPQYVSAVTLDNNNDGTVDFVKVTYSEPINNTTVVAGDFAAGIASSSAGLLTESYSSSTPSSGNQTAVADSASVYVGVASASDTISSLKTDYTLNIRQIGSVSDLASVPNALASFANVTSTDGAKPIIKTVTIEDASGADGMIDKITYTWTENIDTDNGSAPVAADLPTTLLPDGSTATFGSATLSDPAGAAATEVVTGVTGQVTANTAAGSTAISGDLSAKWADATANAPHATGATANESVVDSAAPIVVSVTPGADAVVQSLAAAPVIVFSEAMDTSSLTFSTAAQTVTYSPTWTVGDTTVTLAHDSTNFERNSTIDATISAANAVAGTAVTLVGLPYQWSFSIAASTSGGGHSSGGGGGGGSTTAPPTVLLPPTASLQAQIATLMAQIIALQARLGITPHDVGGVFARDLTIGSHGEDVRQLQAFLNAKGFSVASSGPGSKGNETTTFGALTRAALAAYQASVGISPPAGYFGTRTRAYLSAHP